MSAPGISSNIGLRSAGLTAVLLVVVLVGCETVNSGFSAQTDFTNMPPEQVLALLQNANNVRVPLSGLSGPAREGAKRCNGDYEQGREMQCLLAISGEQYAPPLRMSYLLRACGIYARLPQDANMGRSCGMLGQTLFGIGNRAAAVAVWEKAPGCYSYGDGVPIEGCFWSASAALAETDPALLRMARKSCDTVHTREACELLARHGQSVDMAAVARADAEYHEARQESHARAVQEDADRAVAVAQRNAALSAFQSLASSDPNSLVDAGNQQAAAIRAIGDANAARQQQDAQMRLASQRLPLQPIGQGTNIVAGPATTYTSLQPVATSSQGAQSSVNNSVAGAGLPNSPVGSSAIEYSTPLATSCVRQFWDPNTYNWLSFENNCGQAIYVTYIPHRPGGWAMGGGMHLAPGNHNNIGLSSAEINQAGGFDLYVCPTDSVPVDLSGNVFNAIVTQYRCKPQ
jgi:hypothetical protein